MTTATIQPNLWGQPQRLGSWKEMVREYLEEHPGATPRQVVAYVWQETPAVEEMVTAMRAAPNAAATLAFLLSVAVGVWRLADPPRSAPPNVTPAILNPSIGAAPAEPVAPASAGARPQEDAASVLMPPVVYVFPTPTPSPHQPRVLDTLQLTEYTLPPVPTREAWTGPLPRPTATRALRGGPLPTPQGATQ